MRYPDFRMSSDVTILTDDGASVSICSCLDAPYTDATLSVANSSRLRSVKSTGFDTAESGAFCPCVPCGAIRNNAAAVSQALPVFQVKLTG